MITKSGIEPVSMIRVLVIYEQYQREFPKFIPTPTPILSHNALMHHTIWLY